MPLRPVLPVTTHSAGVRYATAGRSLALLSSLLFIVSQIADAQSTKAARQVLRFGDRDVDSEDYLLGKISAVTSASDGTIFVLDSKEANIKVFSPDGTFRTSIGKRGTGPGELTGPAFRLRMEREELVVTDLMLRRVVRFSTGGQHLRTTNLAGWGSSTIPATEFPLRFGHSLVVAPPNIVQNRSDLSWRLRFTPQRGTSQEIAVIRSDMVDVSINNGDRPWSTSFESTDIGHGGAYAVLHDSLIVVADGYRGSVSYFDVQKDGLRIRRVDTVSARRGQPSLSDFESLRVSIERDWAKRVRSPRVTFRNPPPAYSVIDQALFSEEGALWLAAPRHGNSIRWTVFEVDGRRSVIDLPAAFTLTHVRKGLVYGHSKGVDELPIVQVFRVQP